MPHYEAEKFKTGHYRPGQRARICQRVVLCRAGLPRSLSLQFSVTRTRREQPNPPR